jgi:hypothetical protein
VADYGERRGLSQSGDASRHVFRNSLTTRLDAVGLLILVGVCTGYVVVVPAIGAKVPLALLVLGGVLLIFRTVTESPFDAMGFNRDLVVDAMGL